MVLQTVLHVLVGFVAWLLGLIPSFSLPSWISATSGAIDSFAGYVGSTSVWLPWTAIGVVAPVLLTATGIALTVKGIRFAYSAVSGGGTST